MVIKFYKHFINLLLTFRTKYLLNILTKLKLYKQMFYFFLKDIHVFVNVNKNDLLHEIFVNNKN